MDRLVIVKLLARGVSFGYTRLTSNRESFPGNYSLILHTTTVFHLKRLVITVQAVLPISPVLLFPQYYSNKSHQLLHQILNTFKPHTT